MDDREIDVVLYAGAVTRERVLNRAVVVIDVFRATTVMVEALQNGAKAFIPVVTLEEAKALRDRFCDVPSLLVGERDALIVKGFDLGNSPKSFTRSVVEGKIIIQTTSNGTRALVNSRSAHSVWVASFLNATAAANRVAKESRPITLVCSGRQDRYSAEDGLCAGALVEILVKKHNFIATDIAELLRKAYLDGSNDLDGALSGTKHYNYMIERGVGDDIPLCLQRDIYDIVPQFTERGELVLEKKSMSL